MKALKVRHVQIWVAMGVERPGVGVAANAFDHPFLESSTASCRGVSGG
jgi:hypothetical protein